MSLPGLVIFSPLPPMPTGIGDYTYELLPLLARHYRCTVVAEDSPDELHVPDGITLLRRVDYEAAEQTYAAQPHLYHLGNNPDHLYMLPVMARRPGIVVVHDPGLHHLLDQATAALGDIEGYTLAVEAEYGAPGRLLAAQWQQHELRDRQMLNEMPMLRQLLGPALHVVVHSRHAAHKILREAPGTPVTIAPHPFTRPPQTTSAAETRRRLGIAPDEIVFLSLGFVSHIKRIDTALRALARIAPRLPKFRYVIAGEMKSAELDVPSLARRLGIEQHILTTGYVAPEDFFPLIDMADIVINLRYPVGGETSGTLIRALGSGACTVVVDHGPFAELPNGTAIKLPWTPGFEADLATTLLRLAASKPLRQQFGATAAQEIGRRHHPDVALAAYRAAIDSATTTPPTLWRSRTPFASPPPQDHPTDPGLKLWQRIAAVPQALSPGPSIAIADATDIASLQQLGHRPRTPAASWQPEQEPPRACDFVFLSLHPASPQLNTPDLAARLNPMLSFDGLLVLSVTAPGPFTSRTTGEAALQAAGFRVQLVTGAAPASLKVPLAPAQHEMVWRAIKVSDFIARPAPHRDAAA